MNTVECYVCGRELNPYMAREINFGRSKSYVCEDCIHKGESRVADNKYKAAIKYAESHKKGKRRR